MGSCGGHRAISFKVSNVSSIKYFKYILDIKQKYSSDQHHQTKVLEYQHHHQTQVHTSDHRAISIKVSNVSSIKYFKYIFDIKQKYSSDQHHQTIVLEFIIKHKYIHQIIERSASKYQMYRVSTTSNRYLISNKYIIEYVIYQVFKYQRASTSIDKYQHHLTGLDTCLIPVSAKHKHSFCASLLPAK